VGIDTDNDTVFINETVKASCEANRIEFTRCRPYRKNDQAYVEQKNARSSAAWWVTVVLKEWQRHGSWHASMRWGGLFVNFFQPSFKLMEKSRDGALVRTRPARVRAPARARAHARAAARPRRWARSLRHR
jgi:hypothetical protein